MKARLFNINNIWFAIIPPSPSVPTLPIFQEEIPEVSENADIEKLMKYATEIYRSKDIEGKERMRNNLLIKGKIIKEKKKNYFEIEGVKYKENISPNEETKTIILIKGIIGSNKQVAITQEQYNYILQIAKSENSITAYFNNGFCVNHKYIIFGKLTKNKNIIYPQIKIK